MYTGLFVLCGEGSILRSVITEQLEASIHGMVHDPNLSHRRGYLQIATRFIDYMSPEQAEEYRKARAQIEQEMDLTRTMVRRRMGGM